MNDNIKNVINIISNKYGLTSNEINIIYNKFQNDNRNIEIVQKEIENMASYYQYQLRLQNIINNTKPLELGKNYYVAAFDNNSNLYLHPVSVSVINSENSEVIVDNNFKGYQKHTQVDDIEIAISQIGSLLGFEIVEEYRIFDSAKQKHSIVIKDLVNDDEFYDLDNLKKRFFKLINNGKYKKEKWVDLLGNISVANNKNEYRMVIDYGLNLLKSLPSITEEDYKIIENKYFDMLIFDSIISQSERNFKDYGIICDKETKKYSFAPLFDNVFPSILKNNDIIVLNGIVCNRYELIECLFYDYYDKIQDRVLKILNNKNNYLNNIDMVLKYNLGYENYVMVLNNIMSNLNYFDRLIKEKEIINNNNNNSGFVNVIQMSIGMLILIGFSIAVGYLLFTMQ